MSIDEIVTERRNRAIVAVVAIVAFLIVGTLLFRRAGRWLVREDPLQKSDLIVVLSGSMPARAEEAARIFRLGYAPEVWVSKPENPAAELGTMGVPYAGEESYNRDVLIRLGVPGDAIRIFPKAIVNTEEEIEEVSQQMMALHKRGVIIVTSPQHTRRVKALWRQLSDDHLRLTVHAAWQDSFDADHWWRTTRDVSAVSREMMGLLNSYLGLRVRPRSVLGRQQSLRQAPVGDTRLTSVGFGFHFPNFRQKLPGCGRRWDFPVEDCPCG